MSSPPRTSDERGGFIRELAHRDSIYTYMLYVPPLSRTRHGHYCTNAVLVAAMLLVVNVVLQVSLTIIAGSYIFEQHSHFLATLLDAGPAGASSSSSGYSPSLVHEVLRETLDPTTWLPRIWDNIGNLGSDLPKLEGCCVGAECAASGSPCCPPSGMPAPSAPATPAPPLFAMQPGAKRRGHTNNTIDRALCFFTDAGLLNCAPPTFAFLDRWPELDGDRDGLWASKESDADMANLGCRMGIPVDEVFRHAAYGLQRDADHSARVSRIDLGLTLETRVLGPPRASNLTHAQFEWWRGLVAMCASTDAARCGELVRRGVFDGAMDPEIYAGSSFRRGGVVDLETAVEYCQWMLRPSGLCDMALPGTYMMYRSRVAEKCGKPAISAGDRHANPHNPRDVMVVMDVTYKSLQTYQLIHGRPFKFFLTLILLMWFVSLVDELKDIVDLLDFIRNFPVDVDDAAASLPSVGQAVRMVSQASGSFGAWGRRLMSSSDADEETVVPGDSEAHRDWQSGQQLIVIESISRPHYLVCVIVAVVRLWVLTYMGSVGTGFVLSTHSFKDLLLNALALAFIFELPEFLFKFLVSERAKQMMDGVSKLKFRSSLPTSKLGRLLVTKHFWGLFFIPLLSVAIVWNNDTHRTVPVLEALQCTCAQSGDRCLVAQQFGKVWWDAHWAKTARLAEAPPAEGHRNETTLQGIEEAPELATHSSANAPATPPAAALLQVAVATVTGRQGPQMCQ